MESVAARPPMVGQLQNVEGSLSFCDVSPQFRRVSGEAGSTEIENASRQNMLRGGGDGSRTALDCRASAIGRIPARSTPNDPLKSPHPGT